MSEIFKDMEAEIRAESNYDSHIFPETPLPDFAVITMQPQGLQYVAPVKGEPYVPPSRNRQALHIMCAVHDYERLSALTRRAKDEGRWLQAFGLCHPTDTPEAGASLDVTEHYKRMVECHQSVQMCSASMLISGLLQANALYTLRKDDGSTAEVSVSKILSLIELYDTDQDKFCKVFLCTVLHDDKRYYAYYPGGHPLFRSYVTSFKACPGPQIYFFLIKHRFLPADVCAFIRKTFSVAQQSMCSTAKYNRRTRLAYLPGSKGEMDMVDATLAMSDVIDPYKGLPESRVKTLLAEEYKGPSADAPDYFDFDDEQSVTTLKNRSAPYAKKSAAPSDIDLRSVYDVAGSIAGGDIEVEELGDEDDDLEDTPAEDEQLGAMTVDLSALTCEGEEQSTLDATTATLQMANLATGLEVTRHSGVVNQLGEYQEDDRVEGAGTYFARELERIAADHSEMIKIIDNLITKVVDLDPANAETIRARHESISVGLRDQLVNDTGGSKEVMQEYLQQMKVAVLQASELDQVPPPALNKSPDEEELMLELAGEDNSSKPQGCIPMHASLADCNEMEPATAEAIAEATRLGADAE
jgi:hypothetical protein